MSFANELEEKSTPFEKKYYQFLDEVKDPIKRENIAQEILNKERIEISKPNFYQGLNPHEGFVKSYNERLEKKKVTEIREKSKELYNEDGKRFARPWDYSGYTSIHDPIGKFILLYNIIYISGVFEKKGNYQDLAWKVFNDVDDKEVYLKTLYYPKLTSDDLHKLMDKFEEQFKAYNNKVRFSYLISAGSLLGTWSLAYLYRFKFSTFVVSTLASFLAVQFSLSHFHSKSMKNSLNYYAQEVAEKYPQIKYSSVEYIKSSEITPKKLI